MWRGVPKFVKVDTFSAFGRTAAVGEHRCLHVCPRKYQYARNTHQGVRGLERKTVILCRPLKKARVVPT